jgi:transcription initiation factor IIE alpha subunit
MTRREVGNNAIISNLSKTSIRAAIKAYPRSGTIRLKVYHFLIRRGLDGATDQEIAATLQISENTVRPTRKTLEIDGFVRDSGLTRKNRNGNDCIIWRASEEGMIL